jgi:PrtD family type I secretion system ABC transporter
VLSVRFRAGETASVAQKPTQELWQAIVSNNRGVIFSTFFFSFIVNVLMLTGSLFMLQVYDRVIPSGSIPTLVALSIIVLVLYAYFGVLDYIRSRIFVRVGRKIEEGLRSRVFDVMSHLSLNKQNQVGSQPVSDLSAIRQYIGGQGPIAFFDMPYVPFYLVVVFLLHWVLGVVATACAVIIFVLALLTERSTRGPAAAAHTATNKAAMMTEETRRNSEALYSLGMKSAMRNRWIKLQGEALDFQTKANDASAGYGSISRVFRMIVQSAMLAVGAYLAVKHEISGGSIVASSIIMGRALAPIEQAVGNWQQFLGARKAYERLAKLLNAVPAIAERMKLPAPKGFVEVENAVILLPNSDKPVLQGIAFKVQPGRGLGIIGPTGAGKSTLARALVGLVPLARGAIRLDGATPDQRDSDEHGKMIGYLPQDVQIFDGTVAQNISRFSEDPDPLKIVEAAQLANIHDFIMRLPQGYDTQLSEGGSRLSAGQRQRVALARALFGDPVLLVMDEPNSNLDADGEVALDRAIRASLARKASVIVVAHRPSALHAMDDLLVLANGQMAALGTRDEIMKKVSGRAPTQPPAQVQSTGQKIVMQLPPTGPQTRN